MFVLVCYDVHTLDRAGRRRLRQIAKTCESYGQRVQKSVFECTLEPSLYLELENRLLKILNPGQDSLRIYTLDADMRKRIKSWGRNMAVDFEEPLIL